MFSHEALVKRIASMEAHIEALKKALETAEEAVNVLRSFVSPAAAEEGDSGQSGGD